MTRYRATRRFAVVLAVLALLLAGGLAVANLLSGGREEAAGPVTVEIPEGTDATQVARILADAGVVDSAFLFRLQARFDERAARIRPGTYALDPGMSNDDILAVLSAAPEGAPTFTVTIPEGLTVEQTLERIAAADGSPFRRRQLRKALGRVPVPNWMPAELPDGAEEFEGLLFPDTYEFRRDAHAREVLARLVQETEQVVGGVRPPAGFDRYELLTAASLIEREARIPTEQRKIASVIHNRLEQGIALQIDATVLYAQGEHKDRVLETDLQTDSPWNTYQVPGLPPTPISGAGRSAIEAAAEPADTDDLYYVVVDPDTGRHAFSETYDEFLEHKRKAQAGD